MRNKIDNPVDMEQREGRVQRYKGHAVRKNVARRFGLAGLRERWSGGDPWETLFRLAVDNAVFTSRSSTSAVRSFPQLDMG